MENKKELQLKDIFQTLFKKWWLVLLLMTVGFGSAFVIATQVITPVYEADTVLFIGKENSGLGNVDISLGTLNANNQLIVDYQQIALTRLVIDQVINNTNLDISYEEFRDSVVIQTVEDSRLFTVGFMYPDPAIAKSVSDELAKQLTLAVFEIVGVENIRIIDQAQVPTDPVSPVLLSYLLIGTLIGFLISLFTILVLFLGDDTVKNEDDIEKLLGVTVLGAIPELSEKR
ncbi:Wzz/FepE/Etk N-terminal domain-containing protein [Eubacteriaceae bacterium ES3]|nr:Wzz/FepE/Etk N-terminal domain-containing protein [Eubacteriaceae bacterium ES3]